MGICGSTTNKTPNKQQPINNETENGNINGKSVELPPSENGLVKEEEEVKNDSQNMENLRKSQMENLRNSSFYQKPEEPLLVPQESHIKYDPEVYQEYNNEDHYQNEPYKNTKKTEEDLLEESNRDYLKEIEDSNEYIQEKKQIEKIQELEESNKIIEENEKYEETQNFDTNERIGEPIQIEDTHQSDDLPKDGGEKLEHTQRIEEHEEYVLEAPRNMYESELRESYNMAEYKQDIANNSNVIPNDSKTNMVESSVKQGETHKMFVKEYEEQAIKDIENDMGKSKPAQEQVELEYSNDD